MTKKLSKMFHSFLGLSPAIGLISVFLFILGIPTKARALEIPLYHFEFFPVSTWDYQASLSMCNYICDLTFTTLIVFIPIILVIMIIQRS
jgi:hypothetical protein